SEQSNAGTQFVYGLALAALGRFEEARKWTALAATKEPDNADIRGALEALSSPTPLSLSSFNRANASGWGLVRAGLGGLWDIRPEGVPSPSRSSALSVLAGFASAPKDLHWLEANIPCQRACPAGTDIPEYLWAIFQGRDDDAYRINLRDNVLPGVLGRVCARPCENACRHGWEGLGEPVAICSSKRASYDHGGEGMQQLEPLFPPTGKRIAIVGAGPAGLAVARELALCGHSPVVFEKHARPGGMLVQGIPEIRLPRDVVDLEINQVRSQGVEIRCNVSVGTDISFEHLLADHDAVVLAAGTLRPNLLALQGWELRGISHGLDFLLKANNGTPVDLGDRVVVVGGGFTAMDCARMAARLVAGGLSGGGSSEDRPVKVFYRRSVSEMLVTPGELEELQHEGIPMEFLVAPTAFIGDATGRVTAVRFVRTSLGEPDSSGRRRPVPIEGSEMEVRASSVLLATGQFPDAAFLETSAVGRALVGPDGWLRSGKSTQTASSKVFVAGDFATGASSIIEAIGHAKECARAVDSFLMGAKRLERGVVVTDALDTGRIREMDTVPRVQLPLLPLEARDLRAEVERGFDAEAAQEETQRCYLCHYKFEIDPRACIYCDWCVRAKPRPDCIVKVSQLLYDEQERIVGFQRASSSDDTQLIWINQADCIRCRACVDACPVDAISLQKVSSAERPVGQEVCPAQGRSGRGQCTSNMTG
ncbi:MAG: FAD-dependent oxidoreductase, partial [Myxococcales bacterium]